METLEIAEQLLAQDLEEYIPRIIPKITKKRVTYADDPFQQQDFFRYLISVASHPIGLRASKRPFNSREEDMLNYLVEVFDINDFDRLKKILMSYHDSDAHRNKVNPEKLKEIIRSRRRHPWRPELRIRIKPPIFQNKESHYLDNLKVRVYVFKEEESSWTGELEDEATEGDINQRTVLNSIFKTNKIDSSQRIRPVSEMRCLVDFEKVNPSDVSEAEASAYEMVPSKNGNKLDGDVFLKIRRRYCEPGSKYILRFEFWINSEAVEANWVDQYRRILKRVVYNSSSSCTNKGKSIYDNENQEFYGYVNYKLDGLPSHAIKLSVPIVTLQRRKVNNCEICIEAKNRRLETDDKRAGSTPKTTPESDRVVTNQDFIINHIRLYANCFLYQSTEIIKGREDSILGSYLMENVTVDGLFYNSAQTLINQHRLQSNLNKSEDQSLRRIAFLVLINSFQSKFGWNEKEPNIILNLLISLTKNEYVMAYKVIDDKTLQEVDPFIEKVPSRTSNTIEEIEITILRRFAVMTLKDRVKRYFLPIRAKDEQNRKVTLASLTMFKRALLHHQRLGQIHLNVKNLRFDVGSLREFISEILFVLVDKYVSRRFEALLMQIENNQGAKRKDFSDSRIKCPENDDWQTLLRDLRGLNNDLYLFWSIKGIRSLEAKEGRISEIIGNIDKQNLEKLLKLKIDNFLD